MRVSGRDAPMRKLAALLCWGIYAWGASDSIRALLDRATELEREKNFAEAETILRTALQEAENTKDAENVGFALSRLGDLYNLQGRADEARAFLTRAIHAWISNGDAPNPRLIRAAGDLMMIYNDSGDAASAAGFWTKTLQPMLSRVGPDTIESAELLEQHSMVYVIAKRYGKAEPLLTGAIEILERKAEQGQEELAIVLTNRAAIRIRLRNPGEAIADLAEALSILEKTGQAADPGTGFVIGKMGVAYSDMRRFDQADLQFSRAIRILAQWPASIQEADILKSYATLLQKTGRKREAREMDLRAKVVLDEIAGKPRGERIDASEFSLSPKK